MAASTSGDPRPSRAGRAREAAPAPTRDVRPRPRTEPSPASNMAPSRTKMRESAQAAGWLKPTWNSL